MAWTSPAELTARTKLSLTKWNAEVVDNMTYLGATDGRGTSFPASPVDGQLFRYEASTTAGVEWLCAWDDTNSRWRKISGPALEVGFDTSVETPTTSYADFTTALSLITPAAGSYRIEGRVRQSGASGSAGTVSVDAAVNGTLIGRGYDYDNNAISAAEGVLVRPITRTIATGIVVKLQRKLSASHSVTFADCSLRLNPVYLTV